MAATSVPSSSTSPVTFEDLERSFPALQTGTTQVVAALQSRSYTVEQVQGIPAYIRQKLNEVALVLAAATTDAHTSRPEEEHMAFYERVRTLATGYSTIYINVFRQIISSYPEIVLPTDEPLHLEAKRRIQHPISSDSQGPSSSNEPTQKFRAGPPVRVRLQEEGGGLSTNQRLKAQQDLRAELSSPSTTGIMPLTTHAQKILTAFDVSLTDLTPAQRLMVHRDYTLDAIAELQMPRPTAKFIRVFRSY